MTTPAMVRDALVDALELDLVGPRWESPHSTERLEIAPSRWYLTGFLVPADAPVAAREDPDATQGDFDEGAGAEGGNAPDASDGESHTPTRRYFPSSIGLSVLVPHDTEFLDVTVSWGDYARVEEANENNRRVVTWQRTPRQRGSGSVGPWSEDEAFLRE